ncbi:hypothetical protein BGZ96_011850 [Linnemannia gamsii]|uniref:Uncharacterized protein n=1 Tax=Linnemannia gamsii TaxID=64522 RepID=A0ABQ7KCL3_9FUNG|nr:hypothetical protein BGZ96_011850 [Linnemannia gamsii]
MTKDLFKDQAAASTSIRDQEQDVTPIVAIPATDQNLESNDDYGFDDDDNFTGALSDMLKNGDFGTVLLLHMLLLRRVRQLW